MISYRAQSQRFILPELSTFSGADGQDWANSWAKNESWDGADISDTEPPSPQSDRQSPDSLPTSAVSQAAFADQPEHETENISSVAKPKTSPKPDDSVMQEPPAQYQHEAYNDLDWQDESPGDNKGPSVDSTTTDNDNCVKNDAAASTLNVWFQMNPTPNDYAITRSVGSHIVNDLKRKQPDGGYDDKTRPCDLQVPPGPGYGAPNRWQGQKIREGSQRWANSGGKNREMFKKYYALKGCGWTGEDLQYYHPLEENGHWARQAWKNGEQSPLEKMKSNASSSASSGQAT